MIFPTQKALPMKRITGFVACLLFTSATFAQSMRGVADSVRKYRNIPGLVYAVFTTEAILDSGSCGARKMRTKDPVRFNDRFLLGTTSTTVTAYIASRMVKEGKISWETPIIKVMPELDGKTMKVYHKITLRQWLSQRAGLPPYFEQSEYKEISSMPGTPTQQRVAFTTMMLKRKPKLITDSVSSAEYSVAGSAIAATMLERASKKSWEQLVQEYVNRPLGIAAGFDFPALKDSTQPWGHWTNYYNMTAHRDDYWARFFPAVAPAGNLQLSMPEMIRYVREYLLAMEQKPSGLDVRTANDLLFGKPGFAIGWANMKWEGYPVAYMMGRSALFSSYVEIVADRNLAIVILCNSGTVDGRSGCANLARILRDQYVK